MSEELKDPATEVNTESSNQFEILLKKHNDGSGWFFWIAGLSLINSVIILAGMEWSFLIGLGVTQIIDSVAMAFAEEATARGKTILPVVAFILDVLVAGSFVLWGVLARKHYRWAYIVGMILYALDGLLFLMVQD